MNYKRVTIELPSAGYACNYYSKRKIYTMLKSYIKIKTSTTSLQIFLCFKVDFVIKVFEYTLIKVKQ